MSLCSQSFVSGLSIHLINYDPITNKIYDKAGFTLRRGDSVINTHNNHTLAPPSHPNMVSRNNKKNKIVTDIMPKLSFFKLTVCRKFVVDCSSLLFPDFKVFGELSPRLVLLRTTDTDWRYETEGRLVCPFLPKTQDFFIFCERNYWTDLLPQQNKFLVSLFCFFFSTMFF